MPLTCRQLSPGYGENKVRLIQGSIGVNGWLVIVIDSVEQRACFHDI